MMTAEDAGRPAGASAAHRRAVSGYASSRIGSYGGDDRAERGPAMVVAIRTRTWHGKSTWWRHRPAHGQPSLVSDDRSGRSRRTQFGCGRCGAEVRMQKCLAHKEAPLRYNRLRVADDASFPYRQPRRGACCAHCWYDHMHKAVKLQVWECRQR